MASWEANLSKNELKKSVCIARERHGFKPQYNEIVPRLPISFQVQYKVLSLFVLGLIAVLAFISPVTKAQVQTLGRTKNRISVSVPLIQGVGKLL